MKQEITMQELSDNELEQVVGGLKIIETTTHIKASKKEAYSYKLSISDKASSSFSIDSWTQTLEILP